MSWTVFVFTGASFYLIRLLLGLWGVRDCRRKGEAITDPDLLALVDTLRLALAVPGPIEVRTMPEMSFPSAAAVGWRAAARAASGQLAELDRFGTARSAGA